MSENGEIYTAGKIFTLPPAVTALTNSDLWMRPFWITTSFVQAWRESFRPILNKRGFLSSRKRFFGKLQTRAKTTLLSHIRKKIHTGRTTWRHFWARQKWANFCHSESFKTVLNQQEIASLPSSDVSELYFSEATPPTPQFSDYRMPASEKSINIGKCLPLQTTSLLYEVNTRQVR